MSTSTRNVSHGSVLHRLGLILSGYGLFLILYLSAPRLAWSEPSMLYFSIFDQHIPFISWTIWVYVSEYMFVFIGLWLANGSSQRQQVLCTMLLATAIASMVFILFPSQLPRVMTETQDITALIWQIVYVCDVATNCFPSLHVCLSWISLKVIQERAKGFGKPMAFIWFLAISVSTLTTKQHVIIDAIGGLGLAIFSCKLTSVYFKR